MKIDTNTKNAKETAENRSQYLLFIQERTIPIYICTRVFCLNITEPIHSWSISNNSLQIDGLGIQKESKWKSQMADVTYSLCFLKYRSNHEWNKE